MCCNEGQDNCKCCVYKDPVFISAQALSIVAIFFSWGFWLTGLLGFASFILLQVSWCCKMNKCGLITAGVFACFDALGNVIVGIYVLTQFDDDDEGYYYNYYGRHDDTILYVDQGTANAVGALALIGAGLWIACAVCVFMFVCGRMELLERNNQGSKAQEATETATEVVAVPATPGKAALSSPVAETAVATGV